MLFGYLANNQQGLQQVLPAACGVRAWLLRLGLQ
jgi:hypothetical protein